MSSARPEPVAAVNPAQRYLPTLGVQVWTVRRQLETDLPGTLAAIKAAGYAQIELMRTLNARDFAAPARALGLGITSAFIDWEALVKGDAAALAAHVALARELKLRYLVFGYLPKGARETVAQMQAHAATANAFGRRCRDAGIQLCYHHHAFEFAPLDDGRTTGWSVLLQATDPQLVHLELDVFWCALGGLDPVRTLHELRGRVAQVHLKDLAAGTPASFDEHAIAPDAFRPVGAGSLDFRAILAACAETGVHQCHVEQDESPDPLASLRASHAWLSRA